MKILLDENLPKKLKRDFENDFEASTVSECGWNGKKNGELMNLMLKNKFDAFITIDKNLQFQQNLARYPVTICLLNAPNNRYETLKMFVDQVKFILTNDPKKNIFIID